MSTERQKQAEYVDELARCARRRVAKWADHDSEEGRYFVKAESEEAARLEAIAAALRAPQETGWQPMETAKQEGVIWGVSVEGQYMLNWLDEADQLNTEALPSGWYDVWGDRHQPTHWQPLPPAPGDAEFRPEMVVVYRGQLLDRITLDGREHFFDKDGAYDGWGAPSCAPSPRPSEAE